MTAMARLTALLFAMWVGVTVSTVVDLEKRVIGGQVCGPKERLYHVKLTSTAGSCGGSLISDRWILTAAHCLGSRGLIFADIGVHPVPRQEQEVKITDPPVIFNDGKKQHDLMLLKLPEAVAGIKPIELPDCQHPPKKGDKVQIAGYGSTEVGPNNRRKRGSSETLQCVDMDIIDCGTLISDLRERVPEFYADNKHEHWICTSRTSVDAAEGDSGGGLVYQDRIYGVIEMVHPELVAGYPLVSLDLCYGPYNQWIRNTIAQP